MGNPAKKLVCGIAKELLSEKAIDAALAELDIVPGEGTIEKKVEVLAAHFAKMPDEELCDCDGCGAASSVSLPRCPFCGKGEDEVGGKAEPPPPEDEADDGDDPEMNQVSMEIEEADEERAAIEEEAKEAEDPAPKAEEPAGIVLDPQNLPETTPAPTAPTTKRPKKDKLAASATYGKLAVVSQDGKIERPAGGVEKLESDIQEVLRFDRAFGAACWLLAQKISLMSEEMLWKLRLAPDGKVKYRTFEDFARAELNMSARYARDMMRIYVRFTREEFERVGPSKLRILLGASEDDQRELLEKVKENEGVSKREIAEEVNERRKKAHKASGIRPKGKQRQENSRKITVASVLGKATCKVFRKPEKKGEEPEQVKLSKAAAAAVQDAYCYFDLENDVRVWCVLKVSEGGELTLRRDIRRTEAE